MRRGIVLPFPSLQGFTDEDQEGLQCFVAALPGTQLDILVGRTRREIAILACGDRRFWIRRDGNGVHARDAASGQLVARHPSIGELLAAVRTSLESARAFVAGETAECPQRSAIRPGSCSRVAP